MSKISISSIEKGSSLTVTITYPNYSRIYKLRFGYILLSSSVFLRLTVLLCFLGIVLCSSLLLWFSTLTNITCLVVVLSCIASTHAYMVSVSNRVDNVIGELLLAQNIDDAYEKSTAAIKDILMRLPVCFYPRYYSLYCSLDIVPDRKSIDIPLGAEV